MARKDIQQAIKILKSQKLISWYEIEGSKKDPTCDKYKLYFEDYRSKPFIICFPFFTTRHLKCEDIKAIIYNNYIKQ